VKEGSARATYIQENVQVLSAGEPLARKRLDQHARERGWNPDKVVSPRLEGTALLVPARNPEIRGPVNLTRASYGRDWLSRRLQDDRFIERVLLRKRGAYYLFETLNFADGKRNLAQIRDAVAAEYGPAPLEEIEEYFRLLEKAGVVTFR
jgi:hypothetical protein